MSEIELKACELYASALRANGMDFTADRILEIVPGRGVAGSMRATIDAIKAALASPLQVGQELRIPLRTPGKGEWSKGWNACRDAMLRGEGESIGALAPQWQPIEFNEDGEPTNVPADTPILVPPTKRLGMTVAKWNPLDGWETETTSEWVGMYRPTHFQPLPAPPGVEG